MGNENTKGNQLLTPAGINSMDEALQKKFSKGIQYNSEVNTLNGADPLISLYSENRDSRRQKHGKDQPIPPHGRETVQRSLHSDDCNQCNVLRAFPTVFYVALVYVQVTSILWSYKGQRC